MTNYDNDELGEGELWAIWVPKSMKPCTAGWWVYDGTGLRPAKDQRFLGYAEANELCELPFQQCTIDDLKEEHVDYHSPWVCLVEALVQQGLFPYHPEV